MRWVLAFLYWITEGLPVNRQRDQAHHIRGQLTVAPRLGYRSFRNGRERLAALLLNGGVPQETPQLGREKSSEHFP